MPPIGWAVFSLATVSSTPYRPTHSTPGRGLLALPDWHLSLHRAFNPRPGQPAGVGAF